MGESNREIAAKLADNICETKFKEYRAEDVVKDRGFRERVLKLGRKLVEREEGSGFVDLGWRESEGKGSGEGPQLWYATKLAVPLNKLDPQWQLFVSLNNQSLASTLKEKLSNIRGALETLEHEMRNNEESLHNYYTVALRQLLSDARNCVVNKCESIHNMSSIKEELRSGKRKWSEYVSDKDEFLANQGLLRAKSILALDAQQMSKYNAAAHVFTPEAYTNAIQSQPDPHKWKRLRTHTDLIRKLRPAPSPYR